ncbi:signal peptidase I [uncultured Bacteroides sp.]|uniref:signal peptidase I n=1 Tax=uncultured Bacteroides sp. TaxID=162156 RepID=UPI002AA8DB3F|nr:signal peptidase I [uncultured Bacteroides sp.]
MKRGIGRWLIALAGAATIVLLFRCFAFTPCLIPSSGMENSLFQGERILVNKWSYGLRVPLMSLFSYHRWMEKPVHKNDIVVFNNPTQMPQPFIDQRSIYISRCIGLPGDTLFIDSFFNVTDENRQAVPDEKELYAYPKEKEHSMDSLLSVLSIKGNRQKGYNKEENIRNFSRYEYYLLEQAMNINGGNWIHPLSKEKDARFSHILHPLIIPRKRSVLKVYPWNATLLRNTLVLHEGKQAEVRNDTLYINGKPAQYCYFTKNYYWMSSNNSVNLADSRLFGFVPKDHIIGKASCIWFSKETGTGLFQGYRWNRFFSSIR